MSPIALGSAGGGSVRIPSSFCGLFGMKVSMGRVPLYPSCRDERYPGALLLELLGGFLGGRLGARYHTRINQTT